jgi:pilus assembly protein Flp/PilA
MAKLFIMIQTLLTPRDDEDRGATMVEYGIMVAAIAVVVMAVAFLLGEQIRDLFQDVIDGIGAGGGDGAG